jgi:hypothetical protein
MIGNSEDGDRIFCAYKINGLTVVRGMYDFNKGKFIVLNFYKSKVPEDSTPLKILMNLKDELNVDYDWELTGIAKILKLIENGTINGDRKRKRNKKKNKNKNETGNN